jgi:hypothetical protein
MSQKMLTLLNAQDGTNSAPSAAGAGVATNGLSVGGNIPDTCTIMVKSTAGSGDMSVTLKLWAYSGDTAVWAPLGTHSTAATKGILNEGNAIGETSANFIAHAEPVSYLGHFDRVYCEVTARGGSGVIVSVYVLGETIID